MRSPSATLRPRPIRPPPHHAAAILADIPTNLAAPAPPAEQEGSFWVRWTISPFTLSTSLRQPRARDPSARAALVQGSARSHLRAGAGIDLRLNELRFQGFCHFRTSLLNTFPARTDGSRSRR